MRNELVEIVEKRAIDKEIIARRPGKRVYSGYKISCRVAEMEKYVLDKRAFNPVFW